MAWIGYSLKEIAQRFRDGIYSISAADALFNLKQDTLPTGTIGNITNPMFELPLHSGLAITKGLGTVTATRAGSATFVDRYGEIQTSGTDVMIFGPDGLICQPASTNELLYSEDPSETSWTRSNMLAIVEGVETTPESGVLAKDLKPNTTVASHFVRGDFVPSGVGVSVTTTFILKAGAYDFAQLTGSINHANNWVNIDLTNAVVGNSSLGAATVVVTPLIDGWVQIAYTDVTTTTSSGGVLLAVYNSDVGARLPTFAADGTSEIFFYGSQIEEQSSATSYIPTTTGTVTRVKQVITHDTINNIPNLQNGSTLEMVMTIADVSSDQRPYSAYTSGTNGFTVLINSGNLSVSVDSVAGNQTVAGSFSTQGIVDGDEVKTVMVMDSTDMRLYMQGVLVDTLVETVDSTGSLLPVFVLGKLTSGNDNFDFNGTIKYIKWHDRALTADEIKLL